MNEFIKIETRGGMNTCRAKDLHTALGNRQEFAKWMKNRCDQYGFIEGQDFLTIPSKTLNGRRAEEYHISINMAKELSIVEKSARGRRIRRYFILMEQRAEALALAELPEAEIVWRALEIQKKKVLQLSLKAQVADQLTDTRGLFLPSTVGKIVAGEPNNFIQWLVDNNIMYRKGSRKRLVPKSPYDRQDKNYFRIRISRFDSNSNLQTYFTARGVCWIQWKYLKKTADAKEAAQSASGEEKGGFIDSRVRNTRTSQDLRIRRL